MKHLDIDELWTFYENFWDGKVTRDTRGNGKSTALLLHALFLSDMQCGEGYADVVFLSGSTVQSHNLLMQFQTLCSIEELDYTIKLYPWMPWHMCYVNGMIYHFRSFNECVPELGRKVLYFLDSTCPDVSPYAYEQFWIVQYH